MENHDVPRFASVTTDYSLAKNAIGFTILADGVPISKFEFHIFPFSHSDALLSSSLFVFGRSHGD